MVSAAAARNILLSMLAITTTMYIAPVGKKDGGLRRKSVRHGYWGPPTADFDWCEENYPYSEGLMQYIAEPWNTLSNLMWQPLSVYTGLRLRKCGMLDAQALCTLAFTILIGTGSFLFHATLRYEAQLLDELPMFGFALHTAWYGHHRLCGHADATLGGTTSFGSWGCLALFLSLIPWMFLTDRDSTLHALGRVVIILSFTTSFVSLGYTSTKMVEEIQEVASHKHGRDIKLFHSVIFGACVCAIAAWVTDSLLCDVLQDLPLGLPYPQLHATMWHNLMLLTVLGLVLLQAQYRQAFQACGGSRVAFQKETERGRWIFPDFPCFGS